MEALSSLLRRCYDDLTKETFVIPRRLSRCNRERGKHFKPKRPMNYIRHLNAFFSYVKNDNRLTTSHVSLYLALFQYWNFNRFQNPFPVYRENMMQLSKIGSKNTYHKCMKELHHCKYIFYHQASHKYQPVKISMIRLDKQVPQNPEQLDLFRPESEIRSSPKIGTSHVPELTPASPDNDTGAVPKMGQYIKPNNKKEREIPTHPFFKKNKKIQEPINKIGGSVPNLGHIVVTLSEVEGHFHDKKYLKEEAIKFYNHYKALGWKIQGKTPIQDWKPLVEKWMQNAKKWESPSGGGVRLSSDGGGKDTSNDLKFLYDSFLESKKIFHLITPAHFDQLKLRLDEETIKQAWQERMNQVTGTNQHSIIQLWKAYLTGDPQNELVQKDYPNRIALAKRLSVLKHFKNLKNKPI